MGVCLGGGGGMSHELNSQSWIDNYSLHIITTASVNCRSRVLHCFPCSGHSDLQLLLSIEGIAAVTASPFRRMIN